MTSAKGRTEIRDDEVVAALQRVCATAAFVRAPQLRRLLEYLLTCALTKQQNLKAYTIGVEALGRPHDFDPERDAIVRVQATRLRRALDTYYDADGQNDPVRIRLPAGTYIPVFELSAPATSPARRRNLKLVLAGATLLLIAGAGLLTEILRDESIRGSISAQILRRQTAEPLQGNGLPTIVIRPFVFRSEQQKFSPRRYTQRQFIAAVFSRFELVNTLYEPRPELSSGPPPPAPNDIPVRYDLTTYVPPGGDHTRLQILLSDHSAGGNIVWTRSFDVPNDRDLPATQETVARTLATTLLQPFGVIASLERGKHLRTKTGDPRYRCVLQAMDALRSASEATYSAARACLEGAISIDPGYSLAYAYLASIYNRYFQYGMDSDPSGRPVLDKALWAARRAVQTNPTSARAQFALFLTHFNLRDFDAAEKAMARVRELNEYDMLMLAEYGGRLITLGKIDQGMSILERFDDGFGARTCTHDFYAFIGHYMRGDLPAAIRHADQLTCLSYPYTFIAKALAARATGDLDAARQSIETLRALLPIWGTDPRGTLDRMFPDRDIGDRIMRDLAAVGLRTSTTQRHPPAERSAGAVERLDGLFDQVRKQ